MPPLIVELDVSYQPEKPSGIGTYTLALAEELAAEPSVRLILCTGPGGLPARYPQQAEVRRLTQRDRVRVPAGRIRIIPHQMRPAPLAGRAVVTVHDLIHLGYWAPAPKRLAYSVLMSLLRHSGTSVLTDSHSVRARLLTYGFDAPRVAVSQPRLPTRGPDTNNHPPCGGGGIVYVGNLRPHKDVATLARAHLRLAGGHRLHLVTGDDPREVAAMYPEQGRRLLCIHHRAPDSERDAVLGSAVVCVTPSLDEGFGYAIDEALAVGTPVIASFIPTHVENAAGRDVDFFPPGDDAALAAWLRHHLEAPRRSGTLDPLAEQLRRRVGILQSLRDLGLDRR